MKDPKTVAAEHWKYIQRLLLAHRVDFELIDKIAFHYQTAFVHGWKHGWEGAESDNENMEDGVMKFD